MAERHIFECDGLHPYSTDRRPQIDAPEGVLHTPMKPGMPAEWVSLKIPVYQRELVQCSERDLWLSVMLTELASPLSAGPTGYCTLIFCKPSCAAGYLYEIEDRLREIEKIKARQIRDLARAEEEPEVELITVYPGEPGD